MPHIAIGSKNPVKSQAIVNGFHRLFTDQDFDWTAVDVASGVSDQPMSDAETRRGAHNRLRAVRAACPESDYWAAVDPCDVLERLVRVTTESNHD